MARNLFGLGFLFGAKDDGVTKKQKEITENFTYMRDAMEKLSDISSSLKMNTFLDSLGLRKLNEIGDGIDNLVRKGGQLTTSFESRMTENAKAASSMAVNYGIATDQMGKFTTEAINRALRLNMGMEEAGKATAEWSKQIASAGNEKVLASFKQLGITSADALAKFGDVTKIDISGFRSDIQTLTGSIGFGDKEVLKLVGSFQKFGEETNDLSGGIKHMSKATDTLNKLNARLGGSLDPTLLADWGSQAAAAASAAFQLGAGSNDAANVGQKLLETLAKMKTETADVFAGLKEDAPELLMSLGTAGFSLDQIKDMFQKGPEGIVTGLQTMYQSIKKTGGATNGQLNLFEGYVKKAFDDDGSLLSLVERGGDAAIKKMKEVKEANADLGKAVKAYHTGRTLSDEFELAESIFTATVRKGVDAGGTFVRDSQKAFSDWGKRLLELSKENGPLGAVTRKMIEMNQIGAKALLPQTLRPMAAVFGKVVEEAAPFAGILHSLGFRLSTLTSPMGLLTLGLGAAGVRFTQLRMEGMSTSQAFDQLGKDAKYLWDNFKVYLGKALDFANEQFDKLLAIVQTMDWEKIGHDAVIGFQTWIQDLFSGKNMDANTLGGKLGHLLTDLWKIASTVMTGLLKGWWQAAFTDVWDDNYMSLTGKITQIAENFAPILAGIFILSPTARSMALGAIGSLFDAILSLIVKRKAEVAAVGSIADLYSDMGSAGAKAGLASRAAGAAASAGSSLMKFKDVQWLTQVAKNFGTTLVDQTKNVVGAMGTFSASLLRAVVGPDSIGENLSWLGKAIGAFVVGSWAKFTGALMNVGWISGLADKFIWLGGIVTTLAQAGFAALSQTLLGSAGLVVAAGAAGYAVGTLLRKIPFLGPALDWVATKLIEFADSVWTWIKDKTGFGPDAMEKLGFSGSADGKVTAEQQAKTNAEAMAKALKDFLDKKVTADDAQKLASLRGLDDDKTKAWVTLLAKFGGMNEMQASQAAAALHATKGTIGSLVNAGPNVLDNPSLANPAAAPVAVVAVTGKKGKRSVVATPGLAPPTMDASGFDPGFTPTTGMDASTNALVQATNWPAWYTQDFKGMAPQLVAQLIAAMNGKSVAPPSPVQRR